jgi:hypothetical protein
MLSKKHKSGATIRKAAKERKEFDRKLPKLTSFLLGQIETKITNVADSSNSGVSMNPLFNTCRNENTSNDNISGIFFQCHN